MKYKTKVIIGGILSILISFILSKYADGSTFEGVWCAIMSSATGLGGIISIAIGATDFS